MTCQTCKFSFVMSPKDSPQEYRVCRRYPPASHLLMQQTPPSPGNPNGGVVPVAQSVPPPVQADWTCGEFAPVLSP